MPARLVVPMLSLALASVLWLLMGGVAVVNYDTLYGLLWGNQIVAGGLPDLTVAGAPTPHPLLTLAGVIASPLLGDGSTTDFAVIAWLGYFATAVCVVLLGLVAKRSAGIAAGVIAAVFFLTREPVLSYGLRAYIDLPYLALLLGALTYELSRPRRGTPVLVCLLLAGLLRPEAWLLSIAYLVWLWRGGPARSRRGADMRPLWAVLAIAAPLLWFLTDLVLTGDLLFSFHGTQAGTERLERPTGVSGLVTIAPRRIGEILRAEVLLAAAAGMALLARAWWLRRRVTSKLHSQDHTASSGSDEPLSAITPVGDARPATVVVVGTLAAAIAFALVAIGGLPVIVRYLLPLAAAGCVAAAYALTGWRSERSIPFGRLWVAGAAVLAVAIVGLAPAQAKRIDRLHAALGNQEQAIEELRFLATRAPCSPLTVPNRRAVPLVAIWTDSPAGSIGTSQDGPVPSRVGTYILPSSPSAAKAFVLDARDRDRTIPPPPPGYQERERTPRWVMYARCD